MKSISYFLEIRQIAKLIGSFWSVARALNNCNNTYFKTLPSIPKISVDKKTDKSLSSKLVSMLTKLYQAAKFFFLDPKLTMKNSTIIREFKMDEIIFFIAHFLGFGKYHKRQVLILNNLLKFLVRLI